MFALGLLICKKCKKGDKGIMEMRRYFYFLLIPLISISSLLHIFLFLPGAVLALNIWDVRNRFLDFRYVEITL